MTEQFIKDWRAHTADIPERGSNIHYSKSAERLRRLLREGPYRLTDLKEAPERFFLSHQLLSEFATRVGPGFGIRYTVQVNLFAGTIIGLGNEAQVAQLAEYQKKGVLGCFCLTERLAGVNSGLVVDTTAEWREDKQMFLLNCPDEGSKKNWISQGLTADMAVIVATLLVKGKSHGPHAFVMELRRKGALVEGVTAEDMGNKTIGNDLDNARIAFSNVWLPRSALLDRYAGIDKNEYTQYQKGTSNMDMIGQRLYTGRAVIASSTLVFARTLFASARQYADAKRCWAPKGSIKLSEIPQLSFLYKEADEELSKVERLRGTVESRLCECLKSSKIPDSNLVEMVAVLKVKAIEVSISLCFRLKQELGSYALMGGTGFEKMDYLQCCKFAEGDSRILMQKIARDRLSAFSKKQEGTARESEICFKLGQAVMAGGRAAWNENWREVYGLADAVMDRVLLDSSMQAKL